MIYDELATEFLKIIFLKRRPNDPSYGLTRGEIGTLLYLRHECNNVLAGDISKRLDLTTGRMASVLKSLDHKDFIIRKKSEEDARKTIVSITKLGEEHIDNHSKETHKRLSKMLEFLGEEDAKSFVRIQRKIIEFHDEVEKYGEKK